MTSETPCLNGCRKIPIVQDSEDCMPDYRLAREVHAPNCPNAKPAEPPACDCWKHERQVCDICQGVGGKDKPQSEPPIDWGLMIDRIDREFGGTYSKPIAALKAELDALKAEVENVRQYARIEITDLRAVRGGLEMRLQTELAKNAALKVRVDDLENLVLDIDDGQEAATVYARAIRARRQEASNGK